jgi:hypothetical protein
MVSLRNRKAYYTLSKRNPVDLGNEEEGTE